MHNNPFLHTALKAARSAGKIIIKSLEKLDQIAITEKHCNDFVTEIDKQSEDEIIAIIKKAYPTHAFIGEESGAIGESEYTWIIDPLDGTHNFIHGLPHFCISIALKHKNKLENGLIYDPLRQEAFGATRGRGAFLNDKRIRVSKKNKLDGSLIGLSFAPNSHDYLRMHLNIMERLYAITTGVRRTGSSALDCCYVASGRLDGLVGINLKEWDIAAGSLIIKEAGGLVCDLDGGEKYLETGNMVAGNPKILKTLLQTTIESN